VLARYRVRGGRVVGSFVAIGLVAGVVAACVELEGSLGSDCLKNGDCQSGVCSQLHCVAVPPLLELEAGPDAAADATGDSPPGAPADGSGTMPSDATVSADGPGGMDAVAPLDAIVSAPPDAPADAIEETAAPADAPSDAPGEEPDARPDAADGG